MKKLSTLFFIVGSAAIISGCAKVKDIMDIEIDAVFETPELNITPPNAKAQDALEDYSFDVSYEFVPSDNEDINEYIDKIKSWKVNSLKVVFSGITVNNLVLRGGTKLEISSGSDIASFMITQDLAIVNDMELDLDPSGFDNLVTILEKNENFTVKFKGAVSEKTPYVVKIIMEATFIANPLD